ncbi:MAG: xylulokinase [uncultured bacterium]|nr:MAG: xylulokinase [uncultured bacterium]
MNECFESIYLGIDFGTTRVKATLIDDNEKVLNTFVISWTEAQCNKNLLSDWILILQKVVKSLIKKSGVNPDNIKCMALSCMSPCIVLIDESSRENTSPIILYDEVISTDKFVCRLDRINATINILRSFTPKGSNGCLKILNASSWLLWQLTGEIAIDEYGLHDILGISKIEEIMGATFPDRILRPNSIVGSIKDFWSKYLGLPNNVQVCCGSTDTVALLRATSLKKNGHLIYLGTFFSVLEAKESFVNGLPVGISSLPYQWHISLEGGAFIERLASSFFPIEESRSGQISKLLKLAEHATSKGNANYKEIAIQEWTLNKPVQMLPLLCEFCVGETTTADLSLIPFSSFTKALIRYIEEVNLAGDVPVIGGLSQNEWILEYIEKNVDIKCSSKSKIYGAEGAALLARDGFYEQ